MDSSIRRLSLLGLLLVPCYVAISLLSDRFDPDLPTAEVLKRPIPVVLALFGVAFVLYLLACREVKRAESGRPFLATGVILLFAIAYRAILLPSTPILEIDIYRYLWDGHVSLTGGNPFSHSPAEFQDAMDLVPEDRAAISQLDRTASALADRSVAVEILSKVHYPEVPTVYPPVSQWVFAAAVWSARAEASFHSQLFAMKAWLLAFDLATALLVILLLRESNLPGAWVVFYAWCPLVMKEVANSGHLDSIAVFFTVLSVLLALLAFRPGAHIGARCTLGSASFAMLALATGAKLYPVILLPLLMAFVVGSMRQQGSRMLRRIAMVATGLVVYAVVLIAVYAPYREIASLDEPNSRSALEGFSTFARNWEMNDFLFMVFSENLRPAEAEAPRPWFAIVPNQWRERLEGAFAANNQFLPESWRLLSAADAITRLIMASVVVAIVVWLAWKVMMKPERLPASCYLSLTWLWLCCPTQNPWYLLWGLPFLPFVRLSAWRWLSGLALLYYLRFWFEDRYPPGGVLALGYDGAAFFDFVIVWLEFLPWLLVLAYAWRNDCERIEKA